MGLLCGGANEEHAISLRSAAHVRRELDREFYTVIDFFITEQGGWISGSEKQSKGAVQNRFSEEILHALQGCDIIFPMMHGPKYEDGTLQGFLETLGIAYVGCDPLSAALCMDKAHLKHLLRAQGFTTAPFIDFSRDEWQREPQRILEQIKQQLSYPLFAKTSHLGSSVGVIKVSESRQLSAAIDSCCMYDDHILVEEGIWGRELEFAVIGNEEIDVFPPGEVCTQGCPYDYEAKYGDSSYPTLERARLKDEQLQRGMSLAREAYRLVRCQGMARVDFFLDKQGVFWFNEINPLPGFTPISLFPKICQKNGLNIPKLLDQLIILGLHRFRKRR